MKHTSILAAVTVLTVAWTGAALADGMRVSAAGPPRQGTVVEGRSVPGAQLGSSRAEILEAYGPPSLCVSISLPGSSDSCLWTVDGTSHVSVAFVGRGGGPTTGGGDDLITGISFSGFPRWRTTTGFSTVTAAQDTEKLIAAYPGATLSYDDNGQLEELVDSKLGLVVSIGSDPFTSDRLATLSIMPPSAEADLPKAGLLAVSQLHLRQVPGSDSGWVSVLASLQVTADGGMGVGDALVTARWELPDGTRLTTTGTSTANGLTRFRISTSQPGTYRLVVEDVIRLGLRFPRATTRAEAEVDAGW